MYYSEIEELNKVYLQAKEGNLREALLLFKELEKNNNLTPKEILSYKLVKADLFRVMGKYVEAIEICEFIYPKFQEMGDLFSSFDVLLIQTYSYIIMADITKSKPLLKQAENLLLTIKDKFSKDLNDRESFLVRIKAIYYYFKGGNIQKVLDLNKEAYKLVRGTGHKGLISASLANIAYAFMQMKQFDKALEYAKSAVKIDFKPTLSNSYVTLIEIYITKGELKKAEESLENFRDHVEKHDTANDKPRYVYSKALLLKSSLRARNRVKSEELFKSLALDDTCLAEYRIDAIINLCDLYLTELKITNDLEIIDEIQPLIQELLTIAQRQHSHLILAETYLLQAKLSILTLNIKSAQEFLTQAQNLAESRGLETLAMKISQEHDNLLHQTKLWTDETEISLSDRLELASLREQVEYMSRKRILNVPELKNEESVLFLILTEGGNPIFSHWFIKENTCEDHLFGGFLTTINAFINEMFSERLDRASFGQYTLLMKSVASFLICYIFKGDSYYASRRVNFLIDKMLLEEETLKKLEKFYQSNRIAESEDIPFLESLINKIFVDKCIPSIELI